jgi:hypothetical protein
VIRSRFRPALMSGGEEMQQIANARKTKLSDKDFQEAALKAMRRLHPSSWCARHFHLADCLSMST